jgi:hypothetical protein
VLQQTTQKPSATIYRVIWSVMDTETGRDSSYDIGCYLTLAAANAVAREVVLKDRNFIENVERLVTYKARVKQNEDGDDVVAVIAEFDTWVLTIEVVKSDVFGSIRTEASAAAERLEDRQQLFDVLRQHLKKDTSCPLARRAIVGTAPWKLNVQVNAAEPSGLFSPTEQSGALAPLLEGMRRSAAYLVELGVTTAVGRADPSITILARYDGWVAKREDSTEDEEEESPNDNASDKTWSPRGHKTSTKRGRIR